MDESKSLQAIKAFVVKTFRHDATGHDDEHMKRVAGWAKLLAIEEGADPFLCEVIAWLHDVGDPKLFENPGRAIAERTDLLKKLSFSDEHIRLIDESIAAVSFRQGGTPKTLIGEIVQDADRLDALGAIGIARTFAYGGAHDQPIYQEKGNTSHSVKHFHDKLLKLSAMMNTNSGKTEAKRRHQFMVHFLQEFEREQMITTQ